MDYELTGKSVIITGAGQGIGAALAHRFVSEGCRVLLADRAADALQRTAGALGAICAQADVTKPADCEAMAKQAAEAFGGIDILICNAGILIAGDIGTMTDEDFRRVLDVNVLGYFNSVKAVFPYMKKQRSGAIIQINSKSGKLGSFKSGAYAASKFAGIGLTQSLALEFAAYNIRVNAICPGNLLDGSMWNEQLFKEYGEARKLTRDELYQSNISKVPLGRTTTYEDVANAAVFLASDRAGYMTGQAVNVTGGQEMR